jgi:hypothetical protein
MNSSITAKDGKRKEGNEMELSQMLGLRIHYALNNKANKNTIIALCLQ